MYGKGGGHCDLRSNIFICAESSYNNGSKVSAHVEKALRYVNLRSQSMSDPQFRYAFNGLSQGTCEILYMKVLSACVSKVMLQIKTFEK